MSWERRMSRANTWQPFFYSGTNDSFRTRMPHARLNSTSSLLVPLLETTCHSMGSWLLCKSVQHSFAFLWRVRIKAMLRSTL